MILDRTHPPIKANYRRSCLLLVKIYQKLKKLKKRIMNLIFMYCPYKKNIKLMNHDLRFI